MKVEVRRGEITKKLELVGFSSCSSAGQLAKW